MNWVSCWRRGLAIGCCLVTGWLACVTSQADEIAPAKEQGDQPAPISVATARDRAKVLHEVYAASLEVIHDRYFHGERATVPARALEDVFAEVSRQAKVDARWISVNTRPMSIGHEPKGDFEKQAAKEIAAGEPEYEVIAEGVYRRATPIPLHASCVNCHVGLLADGVKSPRYAGLIISMPVSSK